MTEPKKSTGVMTQLSRFELDGQVYFIGTQVEPDLSQMRLFIRDQKDAITLVSKKKKIEHFFAPTANIGSEEARINLKAQVLKSLVTQHEDHVYSLEKSENGQTKLLKIKIPHETFTLHLAEIEVTVPKSQKENIRIQKAYWNKMANAISRFAEENRRLSDRKRKLEIHKKTLQASLKWATDDKESAELRLAEALMPILNKRKRRIVELNSEIHGPQKRVQPLPNDSSVA